MAIFYNKQGFAQPDNLFKFNLETAQRWDDNVRRIDLFGTTDDIGSLEEEEAQQLFQVYKLIVAALKLITGEWTTYFARSLAGCVVINHPEFEPDGRWQDTIRAYPEQDRKRCLKIRFSGLNCSINVSANRSPDAIAKELQNRLLPDHMANVRKRHESQQKEQTRNEQLRAIAHQLYDALGAQKTKSVDGDPGRIYDYFHPGGDKRFMKIEAQCSLAPSPVDAFIDLKISDVPLDKALRIMEILKEPEGAKKPEPKKELPNQRISMLHQSLLKRLANGHLLPPKQMEKLASAGLVDGDRITDAGKLAIAPPNVVQMFS